MNHTMRTTLAGTALLALALTGCGSDHNDDSHSSAAKSSSKPSSAPASATASASTSETPSAQQTYDNPNPSESIDPNVTPPAGSDDVAPASPSMGAGEALQANMDAAAGKDIELRVTTTAPATVSWMSMMGSDKGKEQTSSSWSKAFPGGGANLYEVDATTDDDQGIVTCQVLVNGVVKVTESGTGNVMCTQPAEATGN